MRRETESLALDDLPPPNASWREIIPFALSFYGYGYWGDDPSCADVSRAVRRFCHETGRWPDWMVGLRTTLFFSQRAHRHGGSAPSGEALAEIHSLIEHMRTLLQQGSAIAEVMGDAG